jgi:hypothetical protein
MIYYRGFAPVRRVPFFACRRARNRRGGLCRYERRTFFSGSRTRRRGTLVSAKVPKAICACAIARQIQRVPCAPRRLRGSAEGPSLSLARAHEIPLVPVPAQLRLPRRLARRKAPNKNQHQSHSSWPQYRRGLGCIGFAFRPPYSSRGRRESEVQARSGGGRNPRVRPRHRDVPWANLLSRPPSEGTRRVCGRRVRGALSFGSLLWARKERRPSYGGGTPVVNNRRRRHRN